MDRVYGGNYHAIPDFMLHLYELVFHNNNGNNAKEKQRSNVPSKSSHEKVNKNIDTT